MKFHSFLNKSRYAKHAQSFNKIQLTTTDFLFRFLTDVNLVSCMYLYHEAASGSDIKPCTKSNKITSITM